jgi:multiple sugar transport system substrate-binding protein
MRQGRFRVAVRRFGPFESAIAKQWETFERGARTGLELEAVAMDLHPLFDATIANPAGRDWDVAFVNTDWVAAAYRDAALCDLSQLLRDDPPEDYPGGWAASLLRLQNLNRRILGVPYHDGPECLIYRKDLLERAGEAVPATWDEFRRLARRLHRPDENCYGTIFAAYPDGHNTVYDFCLQLWTRGGELTDKQGRFTLASPQAAEALTFLREIVNDPSAVHPACRQMDSVKSGLAFAAGEASMMVNWFGFAAMAETLVDSPVKGKIGIAQVPHAMGCSGTSLNIYWILSIMSGAVHKETAWRFLRHCASSGMDRLLTLEGGIGCRKSTWADETVNRTIPFYRALEELHANARELPRLEVWPQVAQIIDRMVTAAIDSNEAVESIALRGQADVDGLWSGQL